MKVLLMRGDKKKIMQLANVSRPTVDKVLNGEPVEGKTLESVNNAIVKIISERNKIKDQISKL